MPVATPPSTINIFDENHESLHHIEFEAPPSAGLDLEQRLQITEDRAQNGRFSIDLSLELERELNMESPVASSSYEDIPHVEKVTAAHSNDEQNYIKPDPDVLAHVVTHMRKSLVDMTKERDELVRMLANVNSQDANTKDALQLMTEKATSAGEELDIARKKIREDEEQIVLLRAKVEESRRGLMRLQTESRRQSMVPNDLARSSLALPGFGSPPSNKRASFTPLTGRPPGHRRISSVSDTSSVTIPDLSASPGIQTFNTTPSPPNSSRHFPGMFGQHSPPTSGDLSMATATEPPQVPDSNPMAAMPNVDSEELETLRKELLSVKEELATAKHDLMEAIEAKEASETCVKALRDFIADNNVGAVVAGGSSTLVSGPVKLPPPPSMTTGEDGSDRAKGWGFKLWGVDSPLISSMPFSASLSSPSSSGSVNSTLPPPAIAAAPLSRKLGGFFSSRSSVSSNSSVQHPISPLQTNAAGVQLPLHIQSQRDSSYSFSDTSSLVEPISPGSDIHGLGAGPAGYYPEAHGSIVVKDVTNLDRVNTHALSVHDKDGIVRSPMTLSPSGSVAVDVEVLR